MKAEGHLLKARREEKSTEKLDSEEDAELIIEGIYGAAHHYIALLSPSETQRTLGQTRQGFLIPQKTRTQRHNVKVSNPRQPENRRLLRNKNRRRKGCPSYETAG